MEVTGHINGRSVELDADPGFPEGAAVRVVLSEMGAVFEKTSLRETLLKYAGTVDGPTDMAEQHDRYIYGEPLG